MRGNSITRLLCGGLTISGAYYAFTAIEYDVTGDAPVEIARTSSASVVRSGGTQDVSWALSPNRRHVVFYMQHDDAGSPIAVALYDTLTQNFGSVLEDNFGAATTHVQIAWIDAQHFVLPDIQGTAHGLRLYIAAGLTPVPLGFTDIWGSGSSSTRFILPFAQFGAIPGGLIMLMGNGSLAPTSFYLRSLRLSDGSLYAGNEVALMTGVSSFSSNLASLLPLGEGEFVLARSSASQIRLMSFTAGFYSASVTRSWTTLSVSPAGTISVNRAGQKLVFLHQPFGYPYGYGEIAITASSFTVSQTTALISGDYLYSAEAASLFQIDSERYFVQVGDSGDGFTLTGIFRRKETATALSVIVADILDRAGYESADYNVSALGNVAVEGYTVPEPTAARGALEPLAAYYPFDLIETDGALVAKGYTALSDTTIAATETRAAFDDSAIPPLRTFVRAQEQDLPASVTVDHIDPRMDYQKSSQRARRQTGSALSVEQLRLPVVCTASKAKQIAEAHLYRSWMEREISEAPLARLYTALNPGDVITLDGQKLRVTEQQLSGGLVRLKAVPVSAQMVGSSADADEASGFARISAQVMDTVLYLMDLPLQRAEDDQPGYYAAASGLSGWAGAGLYRTRDGVNFTRLSLFSLPVTAGVAGSVLASAPYVYMDRVNSVKVALLRGSLSSCTESELLNGSNAALLGDEIIQFQTASLNADGTYTLSNLLRARRATENALATHALGENFVLLQPGTVQFVPLASAERGVSADYRGVSIGQNVDDLASITFTPALRTLQPPAPVHVSAARNGSGDIELKWKRRARRDAEWLDYIDVPLDADEELYDIEIMNGAAIVRSYAQQTQNSLTYMAAEQMADFGAPQASLDVVVYQVNQRYGRGVTAQATV